MVYLKLEKNSKILVIIVLSIVFIALGIGGGIAMVGAGTPWWGMLAVYCVVFLIWFFIMRAIWLYEGESYR